jgi:hypothetical protein
MSQEPEPPTPGQHLATTSHGGRFWEVYLEFEEAARHTDSYRARLAFLPADQNDGEEVLRTIWVIIEPSYEEAMHKARGFEEHQFQAFLRSVLP